MLYWTAWTWKSPFIWNHVIWIHACYMVTKSILAVWFFISSAPSSDILLYTACSAWNLQRGDYFRLFLNVNIKKSQDLSIHCKGSIRYFAHILHWRDTKHWNISKGTSRQEASWSRWRYSEREPVPQILSKCNGFPPLCNAIISFLLLWVNECPRIYWQRSLCTDGSEGLLAL